MKKKVKGFALAYTLIILFILLMITSLITSLSTSVNLTINNQSKDIKLNSEIENAQKEVVDKLEKSSTIEEKYKSKIAVSDRTFEYNKTNYKLVTSMYPTIIKQQDEIINDKFIMNLDSFDKLKNINVTVNNVLGEEFGYIIFDGEKIVDYKLSSNFEVSSPFLYTESNQSNNQFYLNFKYAYNSDTNTYSLIEPSRITVINEDKSIHKTEFTIDVENKMYTDIIIFRNVNMLAPTGYSDTIKKDVYKNNYISITKVTDTLTNEIEKYVVKNNFYKDYITSIQSTITNDRDYSLYNLNDLSQIINNLDISNKPSFKEKLNVGYVANKEIVLERIYEGKYLPSSLSYDFTATKFECKHTLETKVYSTNNIFKNKLSKVDKKFLNRNYINITEGEN